MTAPKLTKAIVYDFDHTKHPGTAPYRNDPNRYLVQARERETNIHTTFRGVKRRIKRWTKWRTVVRCATAKDAFETLAARKRANSLAEWRVTWGGKPLTDAGRAALKEMP